MALDRLETVVVEGLVYNPALDCGHAGLDIRRPRELGTSGIQRTLLGFEGREIRVTIEAPVDDRGLAFDFVLLQRALKERIYDVVDHTYLNDLIEQSSASRAAAASFTSRKYATSIGCSP